ncbi:unnamed protein product [Sphagnum compactum]
MARIVGKLEGKQPGGSVKDRIALKYESHRDPWLIDPHNNNCNFQNMLHMHENMKERFLGRRGIGPGIIPELLDIPMLDRILTVPSDEALDKAFWLASPQVLHLLLLFR